MDMFIHLTEYFGMQTMMIGRSINEENHNQWADGIWQYDPIQKGCQGGHP